ncbi:MAG: MerR family transcriptional regulator [Acidimicrobiia bacterium]|nr:MerR family transcriptional regulator [Acidimicrobiia bacterium]
MGDMLLRIGEFARLVQLPVRTVRYYGDIGLLVPSEVDPETGYRLYELERVERARRLLALKDLGLSLEEIGCILDDALTPGQFRSLLQSRVAELEATLASTADRLERVRSQLAHLDQRLEQPMPDVTVKTTEPKRIAYIRARIHDVSEIAPLFPRLFESVDPSIGTGPAGNIYHHFSDDGNNIDLEAVLPVPDDYEATGEAEIRVIGPTRVACLTHHGAFNRLPDAHGALLAWIDDNGYQVSGPAYEWNIVCAPPVTQDDESYVTEIQIEVARAT